MFTFLFYTSQGKQQLCLRPSHQNSFLFLTSHPLSQGTPPTAHVMRLRKYLQGHRVASVIAHPFERKLFFLFEGACRENDALLWLILDLREGPLLSFLPVNETPGEERVRFPTADELESALQNWREWPVLTPKLRKTLKLLDPLDGTALLRDLSVGMGSVFLYRDKEKKEIQSISAWPLPSPKDLLEEESSEVLPFLEMAGQRFVFEKVLQAKNAQEILLRTKKLKKLDRLSERLDEEENRLRTMCQEKEKAILIQNHLWSLDKNAKQSELILQTGENTKIALNPSLTVLENMKRFFHTAERGKRGLGYLEKKRLDLENERSLLSRPLEEREFGQKKGEDGKTRPETSNIERFCSSDGFTLLRGKNSKGNLSVRKEARGHDIWVHVLGGPGSHVIIRLSYPGQSVPEKTLQEAGTLAANKSWQKESARADIEYAEVRHIKPMKNAPLGTVHIDKVFCTRNVQVGAELEHTLKKNTLP